MNYHYYYILIHLIICFLLSGFLLFISFKLAPNKINLEKKSAYECGFEPYNTARLQFNIHFYLVALLFIIFDVEIMFLFPLVKTFPYLPLFSLCIIYFFLIILGIGFFYEWRKGALEWQ